MRSLMLLQHFKRAKLYTVLESILKTFTSILWLFNGNVTLASGLMDMSKKRAFVEALIIWYNMRL
jgi:hypothetical protein